MKFRSRVLHIGVLAAAAAITIAGCSGATSDPTRSSSGSGGDLSVGITIHQADVYFQSVADAVTGAVEQAGGSATLVNTETNAATEATGIQNFITQQVKGIVTSPLSPEGSLASIKAANAAGIPVVCYNTCLDDASEQYAAAFIESDQLDLGRQTGNYAAQVLRGEGKTDVRLGMLNCNRYEACKDRQRGFVEALGDNGIRAQTVADQEALTADDASKKATDVLTANPDLDVFWSASQSATEGMVAAVKASGRTGLNLFGTDVSASLIRSIQAGDLQAITGQDSTKTGALAVDFIKQAIAGKKIEPFRTAIPGNLYSANNPQGLADYLASAK